MSGWRDNSVTATRLLRGFLADMPEDRDAYTRLGLAAIARDPEGLAGGAAVDPKAHNYLAHGAAAMLTQGQRLPLPVAIHIANVLIGHTKPPKRLRGPSSPIARDIAIFRTIEALVATGAKPNRKAKAAPGSACDDAATAAGELGLRGLDYEAVRKIWFKYLSRQRQNSARLKP